MIARRPDDPPILLDWSSLVMFASELAWLILLGFAGWRLGGGWWLGLVEGAVFIGAFVALWARWMAPKSRHRLDFENRQLLLLLLGSAITVLSAAAGSVIPAAIASVALVVASRRHHRLASEQPRT